MDDLAAALWVFRNMALGKDERLSGDGDDPLVRPAGCARRQLAPDCGSDVSTNDGEVAVLKLEDVRAALQPRGLRAAQMRIWTESA